MTQAASWDTAAALNPIFAHPHPPPPFSPSPSPPAPPPPPRPSSPVLLIPQGLGAFTFLSFQPQRTIGPQLFIGAARSSARFSLLPAVDARTHGYMETNSGNLCWIERRILVHINANWVVWDETLIWWVAFNVFLCVFFSPLCGSGRIAFGTDLSHGAVLMCD